MNPGTSAMCLLRPASLFKTQIGLCACNPRWNGFCWLYPREEGAPTTFNVEFPYTQKRRAEAWEIDELPIFRSETLMWSVFVAGYKRDYVAAAKAFPNSRRHFSGWSAFVARRSQMVNFPFERGWLPVRNRYRAWAKITGTEWHLVEKFYRSLRFKTKEPLIAIHIGAQWVFGSSHL